MLEPGIYLLSACAISFKPLLRIFLKALHLQNHITPTKYRNSGRSSHANPLTHNNAAAYESVYDLEPVKKVSEVDVSQRLSDISEDPSQEPKGERRSETTTQTVQKGWIEGMKDNNDETDMNLRAMV